MLSFINSEKIYLIYSDNEDEHSEVIPETIGQYTELTDRKGNKIFEGDAIQKVYTYYGTNEEYRGHIYNVDFDTWRRGYYPFACGDGCGCCEDEVVCPENCEVIGNVHDNPELMTDEYAYDHRKENENGEKEKSE